MHVCTVSAYGRDPMKIETYMSVPFIDIKPKNRVHLYMFIAIYFAIVMQLDYRF